MALILNKIISGGQTGADLGALLAARGLGIPSGGYAPKGWLTENGPREKHLQSFGLIECEEDGYPARTRRNIENSDGTLLVGPHARGGSRLTYKVAKQLNEPLFLVACWKQAVVKPDDPRLEEFRSWLERHQIQVLNVAGNRESETPGIGEFTRRFLENALRNQIG
jgi:Circularly permutated YpsA SLOG family